MYLQQDSTSSQENDVVVLEYFLKMPRIPLFIYKINIWKNLKSKINKENSFFTKNPFTSSSPVNPSVALSATSTHCSSGNLHLLFLWPPSLAAPSTHPPNLVHLCCHPPTKKTYFRQNPFALFFIQRNQWFLY